MILRMLRVENFKAWRELDVEFGKVTGLFGANSSGKSSVLQFLLMLYSWMITGSFSMNTGAT